MVLNMLFDNYDLLMDSPNGTVKMRKLILQLAVQGKLVEQDLDDEPASELLKRIKAEKEKFIAEGKIKKQNPLPPINKDEIPYELPDGWEWLRLANVGYWAVGSGFPKKEQGETGKPILFCKVSDMNLQGNEKWLRTTVNTIDGETAKRIRANVHPPNTVVFPKIGGAISTNKRRVLTMPTAIDNNCLGITPCGLCSADWLYLLLSSINFTQYQQGTSVPALSQGTIGLIVAGLPPIAEQKRIVAKVDQLMQLCDQLDACQEKASTKYTSLNDAALEKLLSSETIDEFAEHWQFICNNFDLIYNDPAHVNKLRQAILQLAVQGKLAPQDPNDEPASELLKRIKAEKKKLITEAKIKKQTPLPPISKNEIPYELPQGWEWVRLGELGEINPRINVDNDEIDVSFIPMKMISEKYGTPHSFERKKWDEVKKGFTYFMDNDVGLAKITPCFENGKSTVFKGLLNGVGAGTTELHIFRQDPGLILPEYVLIFFKCSKFLNDAKEKMTGTAGQKRVPREFIRFVPFLLPPLTEQKRIVSKVDQLMHLCDELETRLNQSKKDSEMLMQAVLYEAFS